MSKRYTEHTAKSKVCYFCGKEVTEDDFCHGCKHYVCQECDEDMPLGNHCVEDHQEEDE